MAMAGGIPVASSLSSAARLKCRARAGYGVPGMARLDSRVQQQFSASVRVSVAAMGCRRVRQYPGLVVVAMGLSSGTDKQREERQEIPSISSPPLPAKDESVRMSAKDGAELDDVLGEEGSPGAAEGLSEGSESSSGVVESVDDIGKALSDLRAASTENPPPTTDFWKGVLEETRLIEWPVFSKVLGTTWVVVGMVLGSSLILLTVNAVLAAASDHVFNDPAFRDFAKSYFKLVY